MVNKKYVFCSLDAPNNFLRPFLSMVGWVTDAGISTLLLWRMGEIHCKDRGRDVWVKFTVKIEGGTV